MRRIVPVALLPVAICATACSAFLSTPQKQSPPRGAPELMTQYGCPTCHVVPNVPGAVGKVGPSLTSLSQRSYLAGSLPNTPENLVQWIMHPQHFRPGTAMPEMGVSNQDAQVIARFLESTADR
jgi:cytochrome c